MALEVVIKLGEEKIKGKDYEGAIKVFGDAIKENPKAFKAYIMRSMAYQKLHDFEGAKRDISQALSIAQERGKRVDIGSCYFKLGLIYYLEKDVSLAHENVLKAVEYNCAEPTLEMWKNKIEYDLKKKPVTDEKERSFGEAVKPVAETKDAVSADKPESAEEPAAPKSSTSIDVINQHAPLKTKIRDDWYQTNDSVIITIYAKNIEKDKIEVSFQPLSVTVTFPSSATSEYSYNLDPLYATVDPETSSYRVYSTKLEIVLKKAQASKWPSLESNGSEPVIQAPSQATQDTASSALFYPTSSKKSINWSSFKVDDDENNDDEADFFSKLYKDVDDDTKRAMMKSYIESNGTVLTTDWKEAKDKTFETSPPEGMVAKSWEGKSD